MASMKAERPVGTQLFGQAKKEPAKAGEGPAKAPASKPAPKKAAAQKPQETKKKVSHLHLKIYICLVNAIFSGS